MLATSMRLALFLLAGLVLLTPLPNDVRASNAPVHLELGGDGATPWNIVNLKPGDIGIKTVTLHNDSSEDGFVTLWLSDIVNSEGDNPEPEVSAVRTGELSSSLWLKLQGQGLLTNVVLPVTIDNFPQSAADPRYVYIQPLRAGDTVSLNWQWELPAATGNEVQGDSVSFTINYALAPLPPAPYSGSHPPSVVSPPVLPVRTLVIRPVPGTPTELEVVVGRGLARAYTVPLLDGELTLGFASGTRIISKEMPARVEVKLSPQQPPVPENMALVSPVYEVTAYTAAEVPLPVQFDPPMTLVVNYDPEKVPENTEAVFVAYHDEQLGWTGVEPPPGFVAGVGQAAAQVSHFTLFGVLARLAPVLPPPVTPLPVPPVPPLLLPARFVVRNFDISPVQVRPGERVTINAQLTNVGELSGEHTVIVKIEGYPETSRVLRLPAGQSQTISVTVVPSDPGTYQVTIDGTVGTFTVEPIPVPIPLPVRIDRYQLIMITILTVVAITVLLLMSTRRPYPTTVRR